MKYKRPPIVEAVIELRFASGLSQRNLTRLKDRLLKQYAQAEQLLELNVLIAEGRANEAKAVLDGYKIRSEDSLDLVMLKRKSLGVTRLAPYPGWDTLVPRLLREWETFRKIVGNNVPSVDRVGVRFINRIDVPLHGKKIRIEDYIALNVRFPDDDVTIGQYSLQVQMPVPQRPRWLQTINSGLMPPALIDHCSILMDVDLAAYQELQTEQQLIELLAEMHDVKNTIFESLITDRSRELFRQ